MVVAAVLLAGCSDDKPSTVPAPAPGQPIAAPASPSPSPSTRPGEVGTPFDVPGWKVTLIGATCGAAAKLLNGDDSGHTPRVCVASIEYVNTSAAAAQFDDTSSPDFAAFDVANRRYEGTRWLKGPVNPGVKDTNEYVFDVADGVRITSVQIGDVLIAVAT
jgi:hypothetical protein